jgi:hypothetical protein
MTQSNLQASPKIPFVDIFGKALTDAFPTKFLDDTAREVGLVKRERKIKPVVLFWAFVFTVGVHIERSLSMLKRNYLRMHKTSLSDSSWYERFSPELAEYFHQCVIHGIEHLAQTAHRAVSERLKSFLDGPCTGLSVHFTPELGYLLH